MKILGILLVFLALSMNAHGQADKDKANKDKLDKIRDSVKEKIRKDMPGWTCQAGQPIQGSQLVTIQHCEQGNMLVKISITDYRRVDEAEYTFKSYRRLLKTQEQALTRNRHQEVRLIKEETSTLGDEGLIADVRGAEAVSFRKGSFIVYVTLVRPDINTDTFFSRKFGEHIAKVLERQ